VHEKAEKLQWRVAAPAAGGTAALPGTHGRKRERICGDLHTEYQSSRECWSETAAEASGGCERINSDELSPVEKYDRQRTTEHDVAGCQSNQRGHATASRKEAAVSRAISGTDQACLGKEAIESPPSGNAIDMLRFSCMTSRENRGGPSDRRLQRSRDRRISRNASRPTRAPQSRRGTAAVNLFELGFRTPERNPSGCWSLDGMTRGAM